MNNNPAWQQRIRFSDEMWLELKKGFPSPSRGRPSDTRNFLEAVYFRFRTGIPWSDLPPDFGSWKTIFNRFNRWSKKGYFETAFEAVKKIGASVCRLIDSTIVRAHQHAAGA